jgi:uncharacterized membrane protein
MFCKNCGSQVNPNAVACLSCGCNPQVGNKHCPSCGVQTNAEQVICIKCGVSLSGQTPTSDDGKTVAIISYITLIGFIIAVVQNSSNKTKLGAYHLRQVTGFMLTSLAFVILFWILLWPLLFIIGYVGLLLYSILSVVVWIGLLVVVIISFINAINGKQVPAPIVGKLYEKWFASMYA